MANEILPFKQLTQSLAERFGVEPEELIATVKAMCFPNGAASNAQLMMMLSFAKSYDLNPLARECYAFISGGRMTIGVQVDGWSKIANRQENFDGQEIEYEKDDEGSVVAVVSKTFVKGRAHPTYYRAEMKEWKRKTDVWESMPSHQLYVKARNEGIRFAFGVPAYDPDDIERIERGASKPAIETTSIPVEETKDRVVAEEKTQRRESPREQETPNGGDSPSVSQQAGASPAHPTDNSAKDDPVTIAANNTIIEILPPKKLSPKAAREKLDKLISRHVPAARLNLQLGKIGKASVEDLDDTEVQTLITQIERKAK